jgi:hypothetical protein
MATLKVIPVGRRYPRYAGAEVVHRIFYSIVLHIRAISVEPFVVTLCAFFNHHSLPYQFSLSLLGQPYAIQIILKPSSTMKTALSFASMARKMAPALDKTEKKPFKNRNKRNQTRSSSAKYEEGGHAGTDKSGRFFKHAASGRFADRNGYFATRQPVSGMAGLILPH